MSKIFLLLALSVCSLWAVKFHSYKDALILQKESGKIIMLDVIRSDCHYCEDMNEKVFKNVEMSRWLKKRFIPVQLNLDSDTLPLGLEVHFTPTFFFIDKNSKILKKIPGAWNIEDFKDLTKGIK